MAEGETLPLNNLVSALATSRYQRIDLDRNTPVSSVRPRGLGQGSSVCVWACIRTEKITLVTGLESGTYLDLVLYHPLLGGFDADSPTPPP